MQKPWKISENFKKSENFRKFQKNPKISGKFRKFRNISGKSGKFQLLIFIFLLTHVVEHVHVFSHRESNLCGKSTCGFRRSQHYLLLGNHESFGGGCSIMNARSRGRHHPRMPEALKGTTSSSAKTGRGGGLKLVSVC